MAAPLPSPNDWKGAAARARGRDREEDRREDRRRRVLWGGLCVLALVLLGAMVADLRGISRRLGEFQRTGKVSNQGDAADIAAGLGDPRYVDPSGLFSVVPPRHWVRVAKPPNGFFNVVFQGPQGMDMSIQVAVTRGFTFDQLVDKLRQIERNLAATTHMDYAYVGPYRAVKRSAQLFKSKVLMVDFVTGDLSHHVQFSMPPELYDEYEPVFLRLMQTYEPGRVLPVE